jgi:hypothetical protein
MSDYASRILAARQRMGVGQRRFARLLGIGSASVQHWEHERRQPTGFYQATPGGCFAAGGRRPSAFRPPLVKGLALPPSAFAEICGLFKPFRRTVADSFLCAAWRGRRPDREWPGVGYGGNRARPPGTKAAVAKSIRTEKRHAKAQAVLAQLAASFHPLSRGTSSFVTRARGRNAEALSRVSPVPRAAIRSTRLD